MVADSNSLDLHTFAENVNSFISRPKWHRGDQRIGKQGIQGYLSVDEGNIERRRPDRELAFVWPLKGAAGKQEAENGEWIWFHAMDWNESLNDGEKTNGAPPYIKGFGNFGDGHGARTLFGGYSLAIS